MFRRSVFALLFLASGLNLFAQSVKRPEAIEQARKFAEADSLFAVFLSQDMQLAAEQLDKQKELMADPEEQATYWLNYSVFLSRTGQIGPALESNGKGLSLTLDSLRKGKGLRYRGLMMQMVQQQDSALHYLRTSLRTLPQEETEERIMVSHSLAQTFLRSHLSDSTQHYLDLCWSLFPSDTSYTRRQASLHQLEAQYHLYLSRYDSALAHGDEALQLYQQDGNIPGQARALSQMADVLSLQDKHREAIAHHKRAVKILDDYPDRTLLANNSNNLGLIYLRLEENDSAQFCFRRAYDIAQEQGTPRLIGNSAGNMANVFLKSEELDSARKYSNISLGEFQRIGDVYGECLALLAVGEVEMQEGKGQQAMRSLRRSKGIAEALKIPDLKKDAYQALSEAFEATNQSDSAFYYFKQHIAIKDSVSSEEVRKETERLRIKFETRLQEEENQRLAAELVLEQERRYREGLTLVVIGLAAVLTLLVGLGIMYFRNQQRKQQLKEAEEQAKLQAAEKAQVQERLTTALKQIREKDELLDRIEADLQDSVNEGTFADKLHDRINSNQDWMQFVIEFEMVYKGFFDGLNPQEHKLTKNDLRMAALIRLNLSNKEIADVLNISNEGVKKAKHRLKKKLTLPGEVDLTEFVNRISA